MPDVVRTIEIPAAPGSVWRLLSTGNGLRRWLSPELEIDLRTGGAYRMPGGDGETWISGASATTLVTLVHDGFAGIGTPGWERTADAYERGADRHQVLQRLAAAVATVGV
jgi:hypothetical protein